MVTLRKPKPKLDATGQPINTAELYRVIDPFTATVNGEPFVANADTRLLGEHPAVRDHAQFWVSAGTDPNEVARLSAVARFGQPVPSHRQPRAPEIPAERKVYARETFTTPSGDYVRAGQVFDDRSEIVGKYPYLFERRTSLADELAPEAT